MPRPLTQVIMIGHLPPQEIGQAIEERQNKVSLGIVRLFMLGVLPRTKGEWKRLGERESKD